MDEICTEHVLTCGPHTSLAAAGRLMEEWDFGFLPVVDGTGRVIGVVTDRDLCLAVGSRNAGPSDIPVGDFMSRDVAACAPGDELWRALSIMKKRGVHRLPVVDEDGSLRGVLSLTDVVSRALEEPGNPERTFLERDVMEVLRAIGRPRISYL